MYAVIIDTTEWTIRVFYVMGTHTQRSKLQYSYHIMSCHVLSRHVCFPLVSPCPGMHIHAVMFIDMTQYILRVPCWFSTHIHKDRNHNSTTHITHLSLYLTILSFTPVCFSLTIYMYCFCSLLFCYLSFSLSLSPQHVVER